MSGKILGVQSKRGLYKLVGAMVPLPVASYLSLYTTAKGSCRSDILKPLIEGWVGQQQKKETTEDLIQEIVYRIKQRWTIEQTSVGMTLETFKTDIKLELKSRSIPQEYIALILKEIN
jgi:hypothetical protein